jgi:hypothetical protein
MYRDATLVLMAESCGAALAGAAMAIRENEITAQISIVCE